MKEKTEYRIEDLIDIPLFQSLQEKLNEIYSFPSSIIDNEGNILTAVAWQDICTKFHRQHPECEKECIKSDQYILEHLHEANPAVSYQCPHGLIDNATPIIVDGKHLANFFTGQFFLEEPDKEFFKNQAHKFGFDENEYLEAVANVPVWTKEKLVKYLDFIKGFIEIIAGIGYKSLKEKESNEKLIKQKNLYQSVLKTSSDGYWLVNKQGQLLEVNQAYTQMSGYSEQELLNMKISDFEVIEDPQMIINHISKVINYGNDRFFSKHRKKDGTIYDVEISVQNIKYNEELVIVFIRDISDRIKSEKELVHIKDKAEKNERKLAEANSFAKLGSWELNIETGMFTFNDNFYKIFHTSVQQVGSYQMSIEDYAGRFVHPEDAPMVAEETKKAIETDDPDFSRYVEHRIIYHDGGIGHVGVRFYIIKDTFGKTIKTYGINQDITDRKNAEAELEGYRKHLEDLVKERTIQLEEKNKELERMNKLFVGREFRIKELKDKLKELEAE